MRARFFEWMKTGFAIIVFALLVFAVFAFRPAHAGEATITWIAPTKCADGSALDQCPAIGYNIEHHKADGTWEPVTTASPTVSSFKLVNLTAGAHEWRMLTVTLNNFLSDPSITVGKTVAAVKPNPPTGVTAQ